MAENSYTAPPGKLEPQLLVHFYKKPDARHQVNIEVVAVPLKADALAAYQNLKNEEWFPLSQDELKKRNIDPYRIFRFEVRNNGATEAQFFSDFTKRYDVALKPNHFRELTFTDKSWLPEDKQKGIWGVFVLVGHRTHDTSIDFSRAQPNQVGDELHALGPKDKVLQISLMGLFMVIDPRETGGSTPKLTPVPR